MDFLTNLLSNSALPWVSAFVLGLMTAISPCPLATNITAIGFISKDIDNRNRLFINGLLYTLGRAITYFGIAFLLFLGVDQFKFSTFFQQYGEKILGPLLIILGVIMLDIIKLKIPGMNLLSSKMENKSSWRWFDAILLGMIFAMAFCPYSGVLYFGMLVPMTIGSASGLYLPIVFALATGIPVILFAWFLAYTISGIGTAYNKVKAFEVWFRRIVAIVFIVVGCYYIFRTFLIV